MASVLETAKKLNKQFNDGNLLKTADLMPDYERLATNALGFDYPYMEVFLMVEFILLQVKSIVVKLLQHFLH